MSINRAGLLVVAAISIAVFCHIRLKQDPKVNL